MLEDILFSANIVMPLFLIGVLGFIAVKKKIVDIKFMQQANSLTFGLLLPIMLFKELFYSEGSNAFNLGFLSFCLTSMVVSALICCICAKKFVKDNTKRSAIAHGAFRSNFVLLGISILDNIYGSSGTIHVVAIMPFTIALFNILAVLTLVLLSPDQENKPSIDFKDILIKIVKNPLILSTIFAIILSSLKVDLPSFVDEAIFDISATATPIALLSIGGLFDLQSSLSNLKYSIPTSLARLVIMPALALTIAIMLGFRNELLVVTLMLFGTPTAVSATAMTKSLGGDYKLTADVTMLTTLLSGVSIFTFIYLLRTLSLI